MHVWLLRVLISIKLIFCALANECHILGNIKILLGYHCFADNQVYFNITKTPPHICRSRCITDYQCSFIQYNIVEGYCLVANGPCLWLEPHINYNLNFIRTNAVEKCLDWVPFGKVKNAARQPDACIAWGKQCTVGRLHVQSNILAGNAVGKGVYTVFNGGYARYGVKEFLDVQPGCKVSWVYFISGGIIPDGAVQGGYLNNNDSPQPIYVMGAVKDGGSCTTYGYYNPATERGYFEYWGVNECTEMYLMTIEMIWVIRWLKQYRSIHRRRYHDVYISGHHHLLDFDPNVLMILCAIWSLGRMATCCLFLLWSSMLWNLTWRCGDASQY